MRPTLCVVTSRQRLGLSCSELLRRIEWLAEAGIDLVQIRERDLPDRELASLVRDAVSGCTGTSARVVVNDRFDVAIAAGAAGVHLREDSPPAYRIRPHAPGLLVGRSVHDVARARAAGRCDYLLFGTIFPTRGKPADHRVAGLESLRDVCAASSLPVLAIGGISAANAGDVVRAGASGVAAVDSLLTVSSAAEARDVIAEFRQEASAGATFPG